MRRSLWMIMMAAVGPAAALQAVSPAHSLQPEAEAAPANSSPAHPAEPPPPTPPDPAAPALPAPPPGDAVEQVSFLRETGICDAVLTNGLLLHHDEFADPPGSFRLVISVAGGEIHESADAAGLTQLALAAWTHPATRTMSPEQITALKADHGLRLSAVALPDHLRLAIAGPAESLPEAAGLARLLLSEPLVTDAALEKQRDEIRRAVRKIASSRRGVIGGAMVGTVYPDDPRLHLPSPQDLERHGRARAQAWLEQILARGAIEAALVGDVSLEAALRDAAPQLASLPSRPLISRSTFAEARRLERPAGPIVATQRARTPDDRAIVLAGFYGPDISQVGDFRALWIAARVLEERIVARITREGPPLTELDVSCAPGAGLSGSGAVFASASAAPSNAEALAQAMAAEVARLREQPPAEEEVERAAATMVRAVSKLNSGAAYWADLLSMSAYHDIDMDAMSRGAADYESFTPEQIAAVLERYNAPEARIRLIVLPEGKGENAPRQETLR